jgi:hypothetical protein
MHLDFPSFSVAIQTPLWIDGVPYGLCFFIRAGRWLDGHALPVRYREYHLP